MGKALLIAIIVALLAAAVGYVAALQPERAPPGAASEQTETIGDLARTVAALQRRLENLERNLAAPDGAERTPVSASRPTTTDPDTAQRLERLEREIADLKRLRTPVDALGDADALLARLAQNRSTYGINNPQALRERNELRERFLQMFPDDPRAAGQLEDLAGELLTSDPAQAVAALDRWRGRVKIDPWRFDANYANALGFAGRVDEADAAYQSIAQRSDYPENERWSARFFGAYLQAQNGGVEEAKRRFAAIIRDIEAQGSPPALQSTLAGARQQLAQLNAR